MTSARDAAGYTRVFAYTPDRQVSSSQLLDPSGQVGTGKRIDFDVRATN